MAEIGTIVESPSTPVEAAPFASVPSYDFPIIPVRPLCQSATTSLPSLSYPFRRPFSQSMPTTALRWSGFPPVTGQPVELFVPTMSSSTTAYPRGTK